MMAIAPWGKFSGNPVYQELAHDESTFRYRSRPAVPSFQQPFMPSIEILRKHTTEPSFREWKETRVFASTNGRKAIFRNPFEFHMGAYSWELEVLENDSKKAFSASGLLCPDFYQPWSFDSLCLFLSSWKGDSLIQEIGSGSAHKLQLNEFVIYALGSRRYPRFLVVSDKGEYLVAMDGKIGRVPSVRRPKHGYPYLCWLDKAGHFLAVENQGAGLASLRFFDAETGDAKSDIPLNPNWLFPYDEANYRSLGRDSFSLVLSHSTQCVGSLIDEWSSIDFDEDSGVLRLMVYRPVGPTFEKRNQRVCKVQENWVEVRIRP